MTPPFDSLVDEVMRKTGVDRRRAAAAVRKSLGIPEPTQTAAEIERDETILEGKEQAEVIKLFRSYGFTVWVTSQFRRAKVSPGIPDLWVSRPARRSSRAIAGWFETKRQVGGTRSSAQVEFGDGCVAGGIPYAFGDRYAAGAWLVELGVAIADAAGPCAVSPKELA